MTPPLRAVLDVGSLLQQPERVSQLSIEEARQLVSQLAALLVLLSARSSEPPVPVPATDSAPVVWLSATQVHERFGLEATWLHEHRRQLSALGIVSRPSRKVRLYDPKKLSRFLESRREATNSHVAQHRGSHAS